MDRQDVVDLTVTIDLTAPAPAVAAGPTEAPQRDAQDRRQRTIGDRLRRIRKQQGLSLAEVEKRSKGEWKAVVVGAYERGDRAITVAKLARLAAFYGVRLADVLPAPPRTPVGGTPDRLVLDLTRLAPDGTEGTAAVVRFARRVQQLRGDHNGRVLTLRGADLQTLAVAAGDEPAALVDRLRSRGALLGT
jgi:transcriptional regulator with XRE-family HTH domain